MPFPAIISCLTSSVWSVGCRRSTQHVLYVSATSSEPRLHSLKLTVIGKTELTEVQYDWRSPTDYKTYLVTHTSTGDQARESRPHAGPQQIYPRSRLARRQNPRGRGQAYASGPPPTADAAISRRRLIYRRELYSLHVGTNRLSRFKDFAPESFTRSVELQSRARNWIRRELQVFEFLSSDPATGADGMSTPSRRANNAEFLLEYIISVLRTVDIKGSTGRAEELLKDFLGHSNSRLFLHELNQWLRSPYTNLSDWDRHVQYAVDLSDSDMAYRSRENKNSVN